MFYSCINFNVCLFIIQENWKPNVTLIVGNKVEDYAWLKILAATIASGPRKLFSLISREQLENEVILLHSNVLHLIHVIC